MRIVVLVVGLILAGCASHAEPRPTPVSAPRDVRAEIVAASVYEINVNKPCDKTRRARGSSGCLRQQAFPLAPSNVQLAASPRMKPSTT